MRNLRLVPMFVGMMIVVGALAAGGADAQEGLYGLKPRLSKLKDMGALGERKDLSTVQQTEVLLSWLAEERRQPTKTYAGHGGGPIDSNYIQAQILIKMSHDADPLAVSWVAASPQVADGDVREGMRLVLGWMGDRSQIPALIKILKTHPNPRFRQLAAVSLGSLQAVEAVPALETALNDPFSLSFDSVHRGDTTMYPVREAVEVALRVLRQSLEGAGWSKLAKEREEKFTQRLEEGRRYAVANKVSQERIIAAANGKLLRASK